MKKENTSIRLKQLMSECGLRQVDILKKAQPYCKKYNINLGRNDISQYISGKVEPSQQKLSLLAESLNVNEVWLMGYDVPKDPSYLHVNYDNIDSVSKYFNIVVSTNKKKLNDNMIGMIAHILKDNGIIDDVSVLTNKSKEDVISFINNSKNKLIDKKILIDISEDNK